MLVDTARGRVIADNEIKEHYANSKPYKKWLKNLFELEKQKSGVYKHQFLKEDKVSKLLKEFDALVLCTGAIKPIDLDIEGRKLKGVEFALDFLTQNIKTLLKIGKGADTAKGKNVLVIESGDTSVDCITVATRQGAESIMLFERSPKRPLQRSQTILEL